MNCENCDRPLRPSDYWIEEKFQDFHPCENGCDVLSETDFSDSIEYFRFRDSVIKLINSSTKKDLNLKGTIDSLDDHIAQWWDEIGKETYYKENT